MTTQEPDKTLEAVADSNSQLEAFAIDVLCIWGLVVFIIFAAREMPETFKKDAVLFLTLLSIPIVYHTITVGKWGCGLGKFMAGITVVTKDGGKVSYIRAFGRSSALLLTYFLFLAGLACLSGIFNNGAEFILSPLLFWGYFKFIFQKNKRGLHDYIAGTMVVRKTHLGAVRKKMITGCAAVLLIIESLTLIDISLPHSHGYSEKARVAEALSAISSVKSGQQRYLVTHRVYAYQVALLDKDDRGVTVNETHSKFFYVSISTSGCGEQPCYIVTATRHNNNGTVAAGYGLYSLNAIIPDRPTVQIAGCPGGYGNCDELIK